MEDKKSLTRRRILVAAFECITQYGYAKTTFKDIAKRAGISRALIYIYFKNKNDLFVTMTDERHKSYISLSKATLESGLSQKEKLRKVIDIWIIDPYRVIVKSPYPNTWLDELKNYSGSEMKFRELFIKAMTPLLGHSLAEIVGLSYRGLLDDRPTVKTLEKRTEVLINIIE